MSATLVTARRAISTFALVSYLAAVLLFPVLHRLHHLAHGADHIHTAAGTVYLGASDLDDEGEHHDLGHFHAQFDRDLVALGLGDVATAGTLTIDCAYADLTLATCDAAATATHPRTFGDDLLARTHHHHRHEDAGHGAGSLEHAQAHYACAAPILVPAPSQRFVALVVALAYDAPAQRFRSTADARGPPARG